MRAAGLRHVRFHDLRHTFGTQMAAQGMPMRGLQELMGHADFGTTLRYADYAPSSREADWAEAAFGSPQNGVDRRPGAELPSEERATVARST